MNELVYFIKHVGVSPIKIGKSTKESFGGRLSSFKVSSPYGIEVIGVIECSNAIELEKKLHNKYKPFRLNGEWFNITKEQAEGLIFNYSKKEFIEAKNKMIHDFYLIKRHDNVKSIIKIIKDEKEDKVLCIRDFIAYTNNIFVKKDVEKAFKILNIKYTVHSVGGKSKKGYRFGNVNYSL